MGLITPSPFLYSTHTTCIVGLLVKNELRVHVIVMGDVSVLVLLQLASF